MNIHSIWQASTQQQVYRELLDAFSRPGSIKNINAYALDREAYQAVLATLLDGEATLADTTQQLSEVDWSLLQAKSKAAEHAQFILVNGQQAPSLNPLLGSLESPEFGATICIQVFDFEKNIDSIALTLSGPGIDVQQDLCINGLHLAWLQQREQWNCNFPLGVDFILASPTEIVALPRTTKIQLQPQVN